jgi:hypothetical protein
VRKLANFILFHVGWIAAVEGAASGLPWLGPAVFAVVIAVHLALVDRRGAELGAIAVVALSGTLADSGMKVIGATVYAVPIEGWPAWLVPPWITALWAGLATLPRFSIAWLRGRPALAALFGAIGGPLSYLFGTRFGAVAVGSEAAVTWVALTVEYAVALPLVLTLFPDRGRTCRDSTESSAGERAIPGWRRAVASIDARTRTSEVPRP